MFSIISVKYGCKVSKTFLFFTLCCFVFSANPRQSRPDDAGSSRMQPISSGGATVQDRLKPPVSAVNMERKVIKLSGSKNAGESSSSSRHHVQNSHYLKQPAVSDANSVSTSCGDSDTVTAAVSRKIRLSHPSATEKPQQHETVLESSASTLLAKRMSGSTDEASAGETEKKKFKATTITWP